MFFPPGAYFANPLALQMGGMLNPAMAMQQAQQVGRGVGMGWGGVRPGVGPNVQLAQTRR